MPSMNNVEIMGHLGSDPEIRFTGSGKSVASLTVATSEKYTKGGEKSEITEWHKVVAWQGLADQATKMQKGDLVYVKGRLQTRSWEKDGVKRYTTEIVASLLVKCTWFKDQEAQQAKDDDDSSFPF